MIMWFTVAGGLWVAREENIFGNSQDSNLFNFRKVTILLEGKMSSVYIKEIQSSKECRLSKGDRKVV